MANAIYMVAAARGGSGQGIMLLVLLLSLVLLLLGEAGEVSLHSSFLGEEESETAARL
jgi:hypothetical protein